MTNRFQHFKQTDMKKRNIYLRTNSFPYLMSIAVDIVNNIKYQGSSIGRLLGNCLSNMWLKLEIS